MQILVTSKQLFEIFSWGVDYGQLTMVEEASNDKFALEYTERF
jgi:hypothetical protein|nr:MAG TPA: hypothetical protein [Caudoviricetes sp.]